MHSDERIPKSVGVFGPYKERGKEYWKVVVEYHSATGKRDQGSSRLATYECAEEVADGVRQRIAAGVVGGAIPVEGELTLGDLVDEFLAMKLDVLVRQGQATINKRRNLAHLTTCLRGILPLPERVCDWTPRRAERFVKALCARAPKTGEGRVLADSTKVIYVTRTKELFAWAVKQGQIRANPFAGIKKPRIETRRVKEQLRIDQSRVFMDAAMAVVRRPCPRALKAGIPVHVTALLALCSLVMGPRIGELLDARVQDLDNAGTLIWVNAGKTDAARRYLEVPVELQPALMLLAKGRPPQSPLFPSFAKSKHGMVAPARHSVARQMKRILRAAGLPDVCPHGMRGTFMSITAPRVGASQAFFNSVGHSDRGQTAEKHYFSDAAKQELRQIETSGQQAKVNAVLGARPEVFDLASVLAAVPAEQLLQALPEDTRRRLVERLGSRDGAVSVGFSPSSAGGNSDGKNS